MGGAYGRYAPSGPSHSEEHALAVFKKNRLKEKGTYKFNFGGQN